MQCIIIIQVIASDFLIQTSAYITDDFVASEDGSENDFKVGVGSSMRFVRGYKEEGGGVTALFEVLFCMGRI